ncbi:MAG: energy transducer TonB [Gemmatimonadota bacterium]
MNRSGRGVAARGPERAMTRPLLWSMAGHVLALSACLALGAGPGARRVPVVEVLLVAGTAGGDGALGSAKAPMRQARRVSGLRRQAGDAERASPPAEAETPAAAPPAPEAAGRAAVGPGRAVAAPRAPERTGSLPAAGNPEGPAIPGPAVEPGGAVAAAAARDGLPGDAAASPGGGAETGAAIDSSGAGGAPGAGRGGKGGGGDRDGDPGLLRDRIQSRIVYPEEAVRREIEGEVVLRIRIGRGGVPNEVRIARSSGARLLDEAARRGVVRAAPLPSSPGWVEVPVRFRLR